MSRCNYLFESRKIRKRFEKCANETDKQYLIWLKEKNRDDNGGSWFLFLNEAWGRSDFDNFKTINHEED